MEARRLVVGGIALAVDLPQIRCLGVIAVPKTCEGEGVHTHERLRVLLLAGAELVQSDRLAAPLLEPVRLNRVNRRHLAAAAVGDVFCHGDAARQVARHQRWEFEHKVNALAGNELRSVRVDAA